MTPRRVVTVKITSDIDRVLLCPDCAGDDVRREMIANFYRKYGGESIQIFADPIDVPEHLCPGPHWEVLQESGERFHKPDDARRSVCQHIADID